LAAKKKAAKKKATKKAPATKQQRAEDSQGRAGSALILSDSFSTAVGQVRPIHR